MVGVQQGSDVAGKLVELSQPDPLVATGAVRGLVIVAVVTATLLVVQLQGGGENEPQRMKGFSRESPE